MLDLLSTFVVTFFLSYVVLSYVRPALVLCVKDNRIMISHGKLMLTSMLFGLVALLVHVVQESKPRQSATASLRFGRRRYY